MLNRVLKVQRISKENERRIYSTIMKIVVTCKNKVYLLSTWEGDLKKSLGWGKLTFGKDSEGFTNSPKSAWSLWIADLCFAGLFHHRSESPALYLKTSEKQCSRCTDLKTLWKIRPTISYLTGCYAFMSGHLINSKSWLIMV